MKVRRVVGAAVLALAPFAGCSSSPSATTPSPDAGGGTDATSDVEASTGEAGLPTEASTPVEASAVDTGTGPDDAGAQDAADVQSPPTCTAGFDPTFGSQGIVQRPTPPDPSPGEHFDMTQQADGKILVAGFSQGNDADILVGRYGTDGSPDTTFGTAGLVTFTPLATTTQAEIGSIVVQPDTHILVGGSFEGTGSQLTPYLLRLDGAGAPDTSFGTAGYAPPPTGGGAYFEKLLLRPNGSIVALGGAVSQTQFLVAQYAPSGALDTTFGTGGYVTTQLQGSANAVDAVLQPDGMVVVGGGDGYRNDAGTYVFLIDLVRYTTTGTLDPGFGTGGITAPLNLGMGSFYIISLARQSTGAIVAALYSSGTPSPAFYLLRYTAAGVLDTTFGNNGLALAPFPGTPTYALEVSVLANDALFVTGVATGAADGGSSEGLGLARFTANGTLDSTFGTGGTMLVPLPGNATTVSTALQANEQIVVAATASVAAPDGGTTRGLELARYCP